MIYCRMVVILKVQERILYFPVTAKAWDVFMKLGTDC